MEFNPDNLSLAQKKKFIEGTKSALKFAEYFLIDPTLGTPFKATYPQEFILSSKKRDQWICVSRRTGKAQSIHHSSILTENGYKLFKDIQVGDNVYTPNGSLSEITHLHPHGTQSIYKISFTDGSFVYSTLDHNWTVKWKTRNSLSEWKTITTKEMLDRGVSSERSRNGKIEYIDYKFQVPICEPVQFPEKEYKIPPYLLGALLGDGGISKGSINLTSKNGEVTLLCTDLLPSYYWAKNPCSDRFRLTHGIRRKNIYYEYLRELNLWGRICDTKFIPECYKLGSVNQRIELLQGLFDTDGCARKEGGCVHFVTTSKQLSKDVKFVVESLGGTCVTYYKSSFTNKNGGPNKEKWDHHIKLPESIIPFKLQRKIDRYNLTKPKNITRRITNIEYVFDDEALCITIDNPDHLYLTDFCIVTHNCLVGDTLVIDPKTLRPTPIEDAEKFKKTATFDFKTNQVIWSDCNWVNSGLKKCVRLKLGSGADLNLSDDHEVFDWRRGWVKSHELKVGDRILAPTSIPIFGTLNPEPFEAEKTIDETLAHNNFPDVIFSYSEQALKKLLTSFFFLKGRIMQRFVVFMLWNKKFALDLRHLLIRFGIDSRVDEDGNLFIEDLIDHSVFLNMIGFDFPILQVRSPRKWEIITDIKKIGLRPVYDLSVEHPDHNFIGSDVVVHNSYGMTILAIWHAVTQPGKQIVVFAPSSVQINEFFDVIDKWIAKNDFLSALQDPTGGNAKNPQKRTFTNGSCIKGFLMGMSGSIEGGKRGITADVVIVDEAQELSNEDWKVIGPIMQGDQFRTKNIRCYIAGTINNPNNYYYEKIYKYPPNPNTEERIFIPITKNLDYTEDQVEEMRKKIPSFQWSTEYLLEIAESDLAVFKKLDIEKASMHDWDYGKENVRSNLPIFIGVDWDKVQAGTNIAVFQYDPAFKTITVIDREEIPRTDFTYINAVSKILDYYEAYKPDLIITDQGQGEVQFELLRLASEQRGSELASRLVKKALNEKIEVPNNETGEIEKKRIKPFLVGLLQQKLQDNKFFFPHQDETLSNQLIGYRILRQTVENIKYTSHNEHIIDCCLFAIYGIWWLYENELEKAYGGNHNTFRTFNPNSIGEKNDLVKDLFWGQLDGDRQLLPGNFVPRSTFDNNSFIDLDPSIFYNDDYRGDNEFR